MVDTNPVIAVDAMGGDNAVKLVLQGVADALQEDHELRILLIGNKEVVEPFAAKHQRVKPLVSHSVIEMDEAPAEAIRQKKDSSIVMGAYALKNHEADGFFSAGSTGAVLAATTIYTGRIKGVKRPAITFMLPGKRPITMLDLGANADYKPEHLVQFAHMGTAFARTVIGVENPEVGLLNIGSEETKGSMQLQEVYGLFKAQVKNFKGNAEGSDLFANTFDVIVTDGQTGNITLKTIEGTAKFLMTELKDALMASTKAKLGALLLKDSLYSLKDLLNADKYGGGYLLGVKGVVIIGHGHTSARAVKNGIVSAAKAVREGLVEQISELIAQSNDSTGTINS
ncbi:MAG: phosphate acyltransferase PlsX [Coriobacteriia bacterium]|nr:phosphate acyltransferase PlsX [Coriobacteriia bacterium]